LLARKHLPLKLQLQRPLLTLRPSPLPKQPLNPLPRNKSLVTVQKPTSVGFFHGPLA